MRARPSAETLALAEQIRASAAARPGSSPARPTAGESGPPSELVAPLVGRAAAFRHLVGNFQQARGGQAQAVLVVGEAGIGKTRLATEWVAWARAQGADIMRAHALEMGRRLPYQPLVEALRERLEAENAPEDLWLAELARLLPELRVRYPDLPAPTQDELSAKVRLFEAVARLLDALTKRAPLVLLLEDLHWVDGASLDLLRYLGHSWSRHGSRVLLLGTVRREGLELNPPLSTQLADLGRDLPLSQVSLQPLSQQETIHLIQAIIREGAPGIKSEGERREHGPAQPSLPGVSPWPAPERERPLSSIGFLGEREGKNRWICYDEEMNINLIIKEKARDLPGSIIVMETGSVKRLCPFEQSASAWLSALECRNRLDWQQRHQSNQCSIGAGVGAERRNRLPTTARVVSGRPPQTGRPSP